MVYRVGPQGAQIRTPGGQPQQLFAGQLLPGYATAGDVNRLLAEQRIFDDLSVGTTPVPLPFVRVSTGRVPTGTVAVNGTATVTVPFSPSQPDTNYTVSVALEDPAGQLIRPVVTARTVSQVTVSITNLNALNPSSGTVHVIAVNDAR